MGRLRELQARARGLAATCMRSSLGFISGMLAGSLPDVVLRAASCESRPVVVLTDAMWEPVEGSPLGYGHMGYVVWVPLTGGGGKLLYAEGRASIRLMQCLRRLHDKKTYVCPLEAVAMNAPFVCSTEGVLDSIRGRDVIVLADNQGVNGAAVKGFAGARDLACIVGYTRRVWHDLDVDPWVEYVRSKANLADDPSRQYVAHIARMGGVRVA